MNVVLVCGVCAQPKTNVIVFIERLWVVMFGTSSVLFSCRQICFQDNMNHRLRYFIVFVLSVLLSRSQTLDHMRATIRQQKQKRCEIVRQS